LGNEKAASELQFGHGASEKNLLERFRAYYSTFTRCLSMEKNDMLKMVVCEMARRGATMTDIMKQTGLGESAVRSILKKAGLKTRYKQTKVTPEIRDEVMRLRGLNMSYREIAIEIGIGASTVGPIIRRMQAKGSVQSTAEEHEASALDMLENALEMALQAVRKMKEG
jgi:transposase